MNQKFRVILSNIVNGGHPRLLETLSLGNSSGGLENGSAVKSTFCSWGRPEFRTPHRIAHNCPRLQLCGSDVANSVGAGTQVQKLE